MKMFAIAHKSYGTCLHGWTIPAGAIYGNFNGRDYVCTDLTSYGGGLYIYTTNANKWERKWEKSGLTYMIRNECKKQGITELHTRKCLHFREIMHELDQANRKKHSICLKQANARHAKRGDKYTLEYVG